MSDETGYQEALDAYLAERFGVEVDPGTAELRPQGGTYYSTLTGGDCVPIDWSWKTGGVYHSRGQYDDELGDIIRGLLAAAKRITHPPSSAPEEDRPEPVTVEVSVSRVASVRNWTDGTPSGPVRAEAETYGLRIEWVADAGRAPAVGDRYLITIAAIEESS